MEAGTETWMVSSRVEVVAPASGKSGAVIAGSALAPLVIWLRLAVSGIALIGKAWNVWPLLRLLVEDDTAFNLERGLF